MGDGSPPGLSEVFAVRPASAQDLGVAVDILEEAAAWVAARGQDGWGPGTFRDEAGDGRWVLREALDAGELFLAWMAGQAVGTVTLQSADAVYWPGAVDLADARYVHRLAVSRAASGLGIGRALLGWSEDQTAESGRPFVRLDCPARSPFLRAYYLTAGYGFRGDVTVGAFRASLFEKAL
jgi:GNAT superfamily N-acetyltransferase